MQELGGNCGYKQNIDLVRRLNQRGHHARMYDLEFEIVNTPTHLADLTSHINL